MSLRMYAGLPVAVVLVVAFPPLHLPSAADQNTKSWEGAVSTIADYEQNEREDDFDVSVNFRLKHNPLPSNAPVAAFIHGRLRRDFDLTDSDRDRAFEDKTDERIFQAWLEVKDWSWPSTIRIGRQWLHEVENAHVDGLRIDKKENNFDLMVFAGRPVSEFTGTKSHAVHGGRLRIFPAKSELRLHWLKNNEETHNDQFGVGFSRHLSEQYARVYGDAALLNNRGHELTAGASVFASGANVDASLRYYQRLNKAPYDVDEIDPDDRIFSEYYRILNTAQKLRQVTATATKYFDGFSISAGVTATDVNNADYSNRDSTHGYLGLHLFDFIKNGVTLSLQGNVIRQKFSEQRDEDIVVNGVTVSDRKSTKSTDTTSSLSAQISYSADARTRISTGVSYSTYDFSTVIDPHVIFTDAATSDIGAITNVPHLFYQDLGGTLTTRVVFAEFRKKFSAKTTFRVKATHTRGEVSKNIGKADYTRVVVYLTRRF